MAILKNAKHERFAQLLAQGKTATAAYVEAGYSHSRTNAARLSANDHIKDRVKELQGAAASIGIAEAGITKAWIIEQLVDNAKAARRAGDFGPSNKALELVGKEIGMFTGKNDADDEPAESMTIQFNVREAVGDVRITKSE